MVTVSLLEITSVSKDLTESTAKSQIESRITVVSCA